jgi:hypothetical protein
MINRMIKQVRRLARGRSCPLVLRRSLRRRRPAEPSFAGLGLVRVESGSTWAAVGYLVVVGSVVVFVLYLVVLRYWTASRAAYAFVLIPL